jgi:hypothetical protein
MPEFTEQDFEQLSFHDNLLRGFVLRSDDGKSDLVLDIDHITEWICLDGRYEWLIAAADLTFHGVTGLKFSMDWHDVAYQVSIPGNWILDLARELIVPQLVYLDRQYWRWDSSFAMETQLSFGAYGFTLRHRQEPVRHNEQSLPLALRA